MENMSAYIWEQKYWVLYKYIYDIVSHYVYSPKMALCTKKYKIRIKIQNILQQWVNGVVV